MKGIFYIYNPINFPDEINLMVRISFIWCPYYQFLKYLSDNDDMANKKHIFHQFYDIKFLKFIPIDIKLKLNSLSC